MNKAEISSIQAERSVHVLILLDEKTNAPHLKNNKKKVLF